LYNLQITRCTSQLDRETRFLPRLHRCRGGVGYTSKATQVITNGFHCYYLGLKTLKRLCLLTSQQAYRLFLYLHTGHVSSSILLHDSGEDGSCPIDTVLTRPTVSHLYVYLTTLGFGFNRHWLDLKRNIEKLRAIQGTHALISVSLAWRGRDG
jgi:hypothetical protein